MKHGFGACEMTHSFGLFETWRNYESIGDTERVKANSGGFKSLSRSVYAGNDALQAVFGRPCGNEQASRLSKRRKRAIRLECEKRSEEIDVTVVREADGLKGWLSAGRMFGVGRLCRNGGESLAMD